MTPIEILFIIQFLAVFVIDCSGFIEDGLTPLVRKLTGSKVGRIGKPFSCSTCMTFWSGLLYIIIAGLPFWQYIWVVAALALFTPITYALINFIKDFIYKLFDTLYGWFGIQ